MNYAYVQFEVIWLAVVTGFFLVQFEVIWLAVVTVAFSSYNLK